MSKRHEIDLDELIHYQTTEKVTYATSSKQDKQLYITLRGSYEVWQNKELVIETLQPFRAVEKYNDL